MRIIITLIWILVLAATIGTIVVGSRSFEGIVEDNPYEAGLAWDEAREQKAKLGWTITLEETPFRTGGNTLLIDVFDKDRARLSDAVVRVSLARPSTKTYDKAYEAVRLADGRYHALVDMPLYGNWDVMIDVSRAKDRARFKKTVFAEKGQK
jgi:nitrogen fixation protein FixH